MNDAATEAKLDPSLEVEAHAARAAFSGRPLERLGIAIAALAKLARDPNDTSQVFLLGLSLNAAKFPELLARILVDEEGARLLREQPSIDSSAVDYDALRALPADTLGGAYVRFLDAHGLDPDMFHAPPALPSVPAYVAKRLRQSHDLWHVVTGYGPDVPGEVALQAFTYAVTHMPSARVIALMGVLRHVVREPRIAKLALEGYRRGKKAAFLPTVPWEALFERPLAEVRGELGLS
jgi:ubiquinone biosynthesis protein COQ4